MNDSILVSIKKLLGLDKDYVQFDTDLIMHINTVIMILNQLGVGDDKSFSIKGPETTWTDYLGSDISNLEAVKTYIYLKVRLLFDPPTNGNLINAINSNISELEWRLNAAVDFDESEVLPDEI